MEWLIIVIVHGKICGTNKEIGGAYVGGIIGGNYNIVNQCFNIGELEIVLSENDYVGGIIAKNFAEDYMSLISGCMYNNEGVSGIGELDDFAGVIYDGTLNLEKIKQYIEQKQ